LGRLQPAIADARFAATPQTPHLAPDCKPQLGCAFVHRLVKIEPVDYLTAVDISADDKDDIPMPQTAGKAVE
jgi:hypothetical protein